AGPVRLVDELLDRRHRAARMDVGDSRREGVGLGHAERAAKRLHLPIDVRLGDVIEVDDRQSGDAAARERLDGPRADAAQADDNDVRGADARIAGVAVEAAQAAEASLEIRLALGDGGEGHAGRRRRHRSAASLSRPACAASDFGYALSRSSIVLRAALVSLSSAWQLAMASIASGARGLSGAVATRLRKVEIASLYSRRAYCALPSQNSADWR